MGTDPPISLQGPPQCPFVQEPSPGAARPVALGVASPPSAPRGEDDIARGSFCTESLEPGVKGWGCSGSGGPGQG